MITSYLLIYLLTLLPKLVGSVLNLLTLKPMAKFLITSNWEELG